VKTMRPSRSGGATLADAAVDADAVAPALGLAVAGDPEVQALARSARSKLGATKGILPSIIPAIVRARARPDET
jgi:hypothetical protein